MKMSQTDDLLASSKW